MENIESTCLWRTILKESIDDLRHRYPRFSEEQISQKLGISRQSFNRIANLINSQAEKVSISIENLIKIISGAGNHQHLRDAIISFDSGWTLSLFSFDCASFYKLASQ